MSLYETIIKHFANKCYFRIKFHALSTLNGVEYIDHIAYDSVVFGYAAGRLKILVMEYHNTGLFALPGGFIAMHEDLDEAVKNGLEARTGLKDIYLEQFHTFGKADRNKTDEMKKILEANEIHQKEFQWMLSRFISVGYYALINHELVTLHPDALSDSCTWYDINKLPKLIQDHASIVAKALQTLRDQIDRKLPLFALLGEKFTMQELQGLYEVILDEKLHRGTFQRKMLSMDILERHEKKYSGAANKAPYLYSFKKNWN